MSSAVATLLLVAALPIYAGLLGRLRATEWREGERTWWHGYARDGVNVLGFALLFVAYLVGGVTGPTALLLAAGVELWTYCVDWLFGRALAWRASFYLTTALGLGLALAALHVPVLAEAAQRAVMSTMPRR